MVHRKRQSSPSAKDRATSDRHNKKLISPIDSSRFSSRRRSWPSVALWERIWPAKCARPTSTRLAGRFLELSRGGATPTSGATARSPGHLNVSLLIIGSGRVVGERKRRPESGPSRDGPGSARAVTRRLQVSDYMHWPGARSEHVNRSDRPTSFLFAKRQQVSANSGRRAVVVVVVVVQIKHQRAGCRLKAHQTTM